MIDETRTTQVLMGVAVVAFVAVLALAIGHDTEAAGGDVLEGPTWVLDTVTAAGDEGGVLEGTELTAVFGGGDINGTAGCNTYFGGYERDDDALTIGPLASTQILCSEPPLVMEQESAYLALLQSMEEIVSVGGGELVLAGDGAEARFVAG